MSRWHHAQVRGWKWGWTFGRFRFGTHGRDGMRVLSLGLVLVRVLRGCSRAGSCSLPEGSTDQ